MRYKLVTLGRPCTAKSCKRVAEVELLQLDDASRVMDCHGIYCWICGQRLQKLFERGGKLADYDADTYMRDLHAHDSRERSDADGDNAGGP